MLKLSNISKSFPGVKSLDDVSLTFQAGQIHTLVGENGAGKSTLMKIISGAYKPDEGTLELDGQLRTWKTPHDSKEAGIHIIYQELNLFSELSVAENIVIGEQPRTRFGLIDRKRRRQIATETLERLGHPLDPDALVKTLSVADQQMIEIAKALVGETKLLILDEPTAVISGREAQLLFERMRAMRDQGVAVIFISHRLDEVTEISDIVSVLKDGVLIGTHPVEDMTHDRIISMMVGRELKELYPPKPDITPASKALMPVLKVENLSLGRRVRDVSFVLHPGEILGFAGMIGAGRTEVAHALFGSVKRDSGNVELDGKPHRQGSPEASIRAGIGFVTEDRKIEGLFDNMSVAANITPARLSDVTAGLRLDSSRERTIALDEIERFDIATDSPDTMVIGLSGGNQQKALIARWVRACDRVLILDEPTRGVDVGAKAEIYKIIRQLADAGIGIILISSELPELIGLSDRVIVMREGVISGELNGADLTEQAIMAMATLTQPVVDTATQTTAKAPDLVKMTGS